MRMIYLSQRPIREKYSEFGDKGMLTSGNIFWPPKPCLLVIQKEGRETACGNTQRQAKPNPLQRLGGDQNKYKTCR